MADNTHDQAPQLGVPPKRPASAQEADQLIAAALKQPDLSPAAKAALGPITWYIKELQRELDTLRAPIRWLQSLRTRLETQNTQEAQWAELVTQCALHSLPSVAPEPAVWATQTWNPPPNQLWVPLASADPSPRWVNTTLKSIATEHPGGQVFVERWSTTDLFVGHLRSIARGPDRGEER